MRKRSVSLSKQKHELGKYIRQLKIAFYGFVSDTGALIEPITFSISDEGIAEVYLPSSKYFEKISPQSQPAGMIFADGSFLVFYEIIRYGYPDDEAIVPTIYRRTQSNLRKVIAEIIMLQANPKEQQHYSTSLRFSHAQSQSSDDIWNQLRNPQNVDFIEYEVNFSKPDPLIITPKKVTKLKKKSLGLSSDLD